MLVYDGLKEWIKNNGEDWRVLFESKGVMASTVSVIVRVAIGGTTKTLDDICRVTGLKVEQIVRWVPDGTKRISDIYKAEEPCYDKMLKILKERGLSKRELCLDCGMKISTLGTQLNTQEVKGKIVSYKTIKKVATYLGVSPLDLFEDRKECVKDDTGGKREVNIEMIKELMNKQGVSTRKLAGKSGVSYGCVYNLIHKKSNASERIIYKIATALGVEEDKLYRTEE